MAENPTKTVSLLGRFKLLLLTLAIPLGLTLLAAIPAFSQADDEQPVAIFIGDSFTGNYRFEPGTRLQDLLEDKMPGWQVFNHARPGAQPLDYYMQVHQALWLHPRVDAVVLPIQVSKLMPGENPVRMDKRGDNLKWWNVDLSSPLWASLNNEYRKKVLIHKAGLFFGFLDMAEYLYVEEIQSPMERAQMRENSADRQKKMAAKAKRVATYWNDYTVDIARVMTSRGVQDLAFLIADLKARAIPIHAILVPGGNPTIVRDHFPPQAKQTLRDAAEATRHWCRAMDISYTDVIDALPGESYDDFYHLKELPGNDRVAEAAKAWLMSLESTAPVL